MGALGLNLRSTVPAGICAAMICIWIVSSQRVHAGRLKAASRIKYRGPVLRWGPVGLSPPDSPPNPDKFDAGPVFHRFPDLPAEIRHEIWRAAMPTPGLNFLTVIPVLVGGSVGSPSASAPKQNVHVAHIDAAFPGKLLIVGRLYDKSRRNGTCRLFWASPSPSADDSSVWRTRHTLMSTCHEARTILMPPPHKLARMTLRRPVPEDCTAADAGLATSPYSYRTMSHDIVLHTDEMLVVNVEACAEAMRWLGERNQGYRWSTQLPPVPRCIPTEQICIDYSLSLPSLSVEWEALMTTVMRSSTRDNRKTKQGGDHHPFVFGVATSSVQGLRTTPGWLVRSAHKACSYLLGKYYAALGEEYWLVQYDTPSRRTRDAVLPAKRILATPAAIEEDVRAVEKWGMPGRIGQAHSTGSLN